MGNAWNAKEIGDIPPVHPHGCGERFCQFIEGLAGCGSSPRVWGTLKFMYANISNRRFIPTGVGNATLHINRLYLLPVHPHGCGERNTVPEVGITLGGSSPRVWGTRCLHGQVIVSTWFIPTGVGNAILALAVLAALSVHPHGCGERGTVPPPTTGVTGSSPRVWGTL